MLTKASVVRSELPFPTVDLARTPDTSARRVQRRDARSRHLAELAVRGWSPGALLHARPARSSPGSGGAAFRAGDLGPARGRDPGEDARFGLFEPPSSEPFHPMMMPAKRIVPICAGLETCIVTGWGDGKAQQSPLLTTRYRKDTEPGRPATASDIPRISPNIAAPAVCARAGTW